MAFNRDLALRQLLKIYIDAREDLIKIIKKKRIEGTMTAFQRSLLKDVDNKIRELNDVAYKFSSEAVPTNYKNSRNSVLNLFKNNDIDYTIASNFAKVHKDAVKVMQQNFYNNMVNAHNYVGRQIKDKLRKVQLEVATKKLTTGQTIQQTQKELADKLSKQGITSFVDSAGRDWSLTRYAEMSARTIIGESTNKGVFNQLESMGRDLVQLTSHGNPCPICAPLERRVYSLSGNSEKFPSIDNALPNRYGVIHPNCLHRFVPYVEELADDVDRDVELSNRLFDTEEAGID